VYYICQGHISGEWQLNAITQQQPSIHINLHQHYNQQLKVTGFFILDPSPHPPAIQSPSCSLLCFALFRKDSHLTSRHLQLLIATTRWNNSLLGECETISFCDIDRESPCPHGRILIESFGYYSSQHLAGFCFYFYQKKKKNPRLFNIFAMDRRIDRSSFQLKNTHTWVAVPKSFFLRTSIKYMENSVLFLWGVEARWVKNVLCSIYIYMKCFPPRDHAWFLHMCLFR